MRVTTLTCLSMALFLTGNAQQRFISADYTRYYDWFHEHAQTELLYTPQASLYIFEYETPLREAPCADSEVVAHLSIGQRVKNLISPALENSSMEADINGYVDLWYPVATMDEKGAPIQGYVWGGFLAKGWRFFDLENDEQRELIMLGVSSQARESLEDIRAEIRILRGTHLLAQIQVPGLCVFEECASSALLRIIPDQPQPGQQIIEAGTLTVGCEVGIEKNYFYWDGLQLKRVMHGAFAFQPNQNIEPFITDKKPKGDDTYEITEYWYAGEDQFFNPIWKQKKTILDKEDLNSPPIVKVK